MARYPILLAHGIARFDAGWTHLAHNRNDWALDLFHYFRGIRMMLLREGFAVYHASVAWADPVEQRAEQLKENVLAVLRISGAARVNIIAHSMGGLDARHMMFRDRNRGRIHERVASLTTIGTPHEGTSFADAGLAAHGEFVDVLLALKIDLQGFRDLTREAAVRFNDHPVVRAFEGEMARSTELRAYTGRSSRKAVLSVLGLPFDLIQQEEGDNDGLVSVRSALWERALEREVWDEVDHLNELAWGDLRQWVFRGEGQLALMERIHEKYLSIAQRLP